MKKHLSTIVLIIIFFVGISVLLYPSVSNYINVRNQTKAIMSYDETVQEIEENEREQIIQRAREFNEELHKIPLAFYNPEKMEGYRDTLDVTGTGIMGYISIEKIDVKLPIYHGTGSEVLTIACGHLEGTSLPVGGVNTHTVLSAHRGLPSAKLFTELDKLEVNDIFTITVLNQVLTYQVTEIEIVEPHETDSLLIKDGQELCTLVTCTPYGINTHRLLVHAKRIENIEEVEIIVTADGFEIDPAHVAPIFAAPILLMLLIYLLVRYRKKKKSNQTGEE